MKIKFYYLLLAVLVLSFNIISAQTSALDSTFHYEGISTTNFMYGHTQSSNSVAIYNNNIYIAGIIAESLDSSSLIANNDFIIGCYEFDGSLDSTFGVDGFVITSFGTNYDEAYDLLVQPNGKLIALGRTGICSTAFPEGLGGENIALARYNTDGSLDSTFDGDGKVITSVIDSLEIKDKAISGVLQVDGKIIVAGSFTDAINMIDAWLIIRYKSDGSLDSTFDGDGKKLIFSDQFMGIAEKVLVQDDGKILVMGNESESSGNLNAVILRLNNDGSPDSTFSGDGIEVIHFGNDYEGITSGCVQSDGKILITATTSDYVVSDIAVARLNPDGSMDNSFDLDGMLIIDISNNDYAGEVAISDNDKIVILGYQSNSLITGDMDMVLIKLNIDGSYYTNFDGDGIVRNDLNASYDMVIQDDGKVVTTGTGSDITLIRFRDITNTLQQVTHEVDHHELVYPNPTYNSFSINHDINHIEEVQILDTSGRIIHSCVASHSYSVTDLKSGIYFVRVLYEKSSNVFKLIKY